MIWVSFTLRRSGNFQPSEQVQNSKKYYFIADPHVIYSEPISLTSISSSNTSFNKNMEYAIYYQMLSRTSIKFQLKNISQFNWNHILIHSNFKTRSFKVVTNFNYYYPEFSMDNFDSSYDLNLQLQKTIFCSNNEFCGGLTNKAYLNNVFWGAAFYKDLRLSEGTNWNFFNSQEYISGA